jgi:hypothetical protein
VKHLLRLVVALGILAVPAVAGAQVTVGARVRFDFPDVAFDPAAPIELAAFATMPLNDVVAFQPEGLFSVQRTEVSEPRLTVKRKRDYFQVPLLGRFRVAKGSPVAVLAGPWFGLSTRVQPNVPARPDEFAEDSEIEVKRFDFGFVGGVGADVGHLVLDGRYTWGLPNIAKNGGTEASDNGSAKHRVLSLSVGLRF